MQSREEAFALLRDYTKNENLIKHMLAVEASMKAYARKFGENEEKWGIAGLLHDFDYEMYPSLEHHPFKGVEILRGKGYPEDLLRAILAHGNHTGTKRENLFEKTIFAVDELTGFLTACALVQPSKSLVEVKVPSVKRKMKDKAFAKGVSRDDIFQGVQELGVDLDEHIEFVLQAMIGIADQLGLDGKNS